MKSLELKIDSSDVENKNKGLKEITETKCVCDACGNVWFYGKSDEIAEKNKKVANAGKAMMCCGGCFPALLIKDKDVIDLGKCPKCGSRAVKKETVTHYV